MSNAVKPQAARAPQKPMGQPHTPALETAELVGRHLAFGWWTILIFLTIGLVLEGLHGLKIQSYLGVHQETRRLMWTLAHAHGTLLGVLNLGFAYTLGVIVRWPEKSRNFASVLLRAATLLMPAGFFLGGLFTYSGDPGLGILLVPVGGILLFIAVFAAAKAAGRSRQ
jgi:hypothetical protein